MSFRFARAPFPLLIAFVLAAALGGCAKDRAETTGSISQSATLAPPDWRRRAEALGEQYNKNPNDPQIAIAYAHALRGNDQQAQAAAVLQQASIKHPRNRAVLGAYGRALADTGQYQQAFDVLSRAHTPDNPDWRILNAQGTVLDQMGRHAQARRYYDTALKIAPNEPSILSNLGLSYLLTHDLPRAEKALRTASVQPHAEPKVKQNLALVLGMEGKMAEAEKVAAGNLPPEQAEARVAELRATLAQQNAQHEQRNPWKILRQQKTASNS